MKGRHAIKTGFEFRHHNFPVQGWGAGGVAGNFNFDRLGTAGFDAVGNNLNQTGDPFASFLLGQVHASNQTIPAFTSFRETYTGLFINDEFKVSDKLTLTLGLRYDYQSARTEKDNQYSTFSPTTPNPGAGNIPGAVIFAGDGPGRSGQTKFEDVPNDAWGPRVGFAYRVDDKQALRGGYGMYYAHVSFSQFGGSPTQGFASNPFAPNNTNGIFPAHHLDQGFPEDRVQFPPFIDPTINLGGNVTAVTPDGLTLPRFQNWSVTYQRELTDNMMLDISYIGNTRHPAEPPFRDARRRREHERSQCAVAGHGGAAVQHQLGAGPKRRHPDPVSGVQRQRGPGAAGVPAVSADPVAGRADRPEPVPRDGTGAGASVLTWSCRRASATRTRTS